MLQAPYRGSLAGAKDLEGDNFLWIQAPSLGLVPQFSLCIYFLNTKVGILLIVILASQVVRAFPVAQWVKNLPAMQETQEMWVQLISGPGRSLGGGNDNLLQYSSWKTPWIENLVGYSPYGCKKLDTTEWLSKHKFWWGFNTCRASQLT